MSTAYVIDDLFSLVVCMHRFPDGWVGTSPPGQRAPNRAAANAICVRCLSCDTLSEPMARLRSASKRGSKLYLFPTFEDVAAAGTRFDSAVHRVEQTCDFCAQRIRNEQHALDPR